MKKHRSAKMAGWNKDTIEALEEILGLLRITEDNVSNRSTEPATLETNRMLTAPAPAVYNESILTSTMVLDPEWFNRDRMKFED